MLVRLLADPQLLFELVHLALPRIHPGHGIRHVFAICKLLAVTICREFKACRFMACIEGMHIDGLFLVVPRTNEVLKGTKGRMLDCLHGSQRYNAVIVRHLYLEE